MDVRRCLTLNQPSRCITAYKGLKQKLYWVSQRWSQKNEMKRWKVTDWMRVEAWGSISWPFLYHVMCGVGTARAGQRTMNVVLRPTWRRSDREMSSAASDCRCGDTTYTQQMNAVSRYRRPVLDHLYFRFPPSWKHRISNTQNRILNI